MSKRKSSWISKQYAKVIVKLERDSRKMNKGGDESSQVVGETRTCHFFGTIGANREDLLKRRIASKKDPRDETLREASERREKAQLRRRRNDRRRKCNKRETVRKKAPELSAL